MVSRFFDLNKLLSATGVNPYVGPSPNRGFDCPRHRRVESGSLIVTTLGGVHHFSCHLCGWGSVGPIGLVSRTFDIDMQEAADTIHRTGAFVGPPQMLEPQLHLESLQRRVVNLYRDAINSGLRPDDGGEFWSDLGASFLGRAVCHASDLAVALGPDLSAGVSDSRGGRAKVIFRILWSLCGSPSVLLIESPSGMETRRIRLDRQPGTNIALLSMPPVSTKLIWTEKVIAFTDEKSATTLWPWISDYCVRNGIPAIAVHSISGSPERCGRFGEVDVLVEGAGSSINGLAFEGGLSSDVRILRIANGARRGIDAGGFMRMEACPSWRPNLLRPMDDMVSITSNMCSEGADSMAEVAVRSVMTSGLVSARQRCEFLSRISTLEAGASDRLVEIAMSTPVSAPGFVLIPTASGYVRRSTSPRVEADTLVTNFRILPVCTVSGRSGGSSILKIVSHDGVEFFVSVDPSAMRKPTKFVEEIRKEGATHGVSIAASDLRSSRALSDGVLMGGMGVISEVSPHLGFRDGEFTSPGGLADSGVPSAQSLVKWVSERSGIMPGDCGWKETLSSIVEDDLSRGLGQDSSGPAVALALAIHFLKSCSESAGDNRVVLSDNRMLEMVSAVSGIQLVDGAWLSGLDKFPFDMSRVPVCHKGRVKARSKNLPRFILSSGVRQEGVVNGPGVVSLYAARGFDLAIPRPCLLEIASVAASSPDVGSAMISLLDLPREIIAMCRDAAEIASRAIGEGIPGFARAFLEFMASDAATPFVVGEGGDGEFLVSKDAIRVSCLEFGIQCPPESRTIPVLVSSGLCRGVRRVNRGGERERFLVVPSNVLREGDATPIAI